MASAHQHVSPGPSALSLRYRWLSPAVMSLLICGFATSGFAFTLRHFDANGHLSAGYSVAMALTAASLAGTLACLWVTHCVDPGYVTPRAVPDDTLSAVLQGTLDPQALGWSRDVHTGRWLDAQGRRYCDVCHVWRPHRAAHCYECGFCVERHDHHCAVVGTCVARRNHATFAGMLCCAAAGLVVMACCAAAQVHDGVRRGLSPGEGRLWVYILLLALYSLMIYAVVPFGATHVALLLSNGTTRSLLRGAASKHADGGAAHRAQMKCCTGLAEVCCVPCRRRDAVLHEWLRRKAEPTEMVSPPAHAIISMSPAHGSTADSSSQSAAGAPPPPP